MKHDEENEHQIEKEFEEAVALTKSKFRGMSVDEINALIDEAIEWARKQESQADQQKRISNSTDHSTNS